MDMLDLNELDLDPPGACSVACLAMNIDLQQRGVVGPEHSPDCPNNAGKPTRAGEKR